MKRATPPAVALTTCIFALSVAVSLGAYCSEYDLYRCLDPFESKWSKNGDDEMFNFYTDDEFNEMCRDYEVYEDCLRPFKHSCSTVQRSVFEGEEDAFGYACGPGAKVYLEHSHCFQNDELQREGLRCIEEYNSAHNRLEAELTYSRGRSINDIKEEYCDVVDQVLECTRDAVELHCNEEIAEWQYKVDTKLLKPTLDKLNCDDGGISHWTIVAIICACLFGAVLIISCVLLACKRRQRAARGGSAAVSPPPPPMQMYPPPPVAGPPQPPSYMEKAPPYQPSAGPWTVPAPSAPSYTTESSGNNPMALQPNGYDNLTYKQ